MPTVFVLMPFDEEFDSVYEHFLKPVLEDKGFDVSRADNIQNQQNILKDIFEKIVTCDLIIADLTLNNPNVFYELGIAHATKKPVILVTQSIEDVPFDLKSYRLIEYSLHFIKVKESMAQLSEYADGFLKGSIRFGNPYTDFFPHDSNAVNHQAHDPVSHVPTKSQTTSSVGDEEVDDRGLFDHLVDINEGYDQIASIIEGVTVDLQELTISLQNTTNDFSTINSNPGASSAAAVQRVSRRAAERISAFNQGLAQANDKYGGIVEGIEDSLEFMIGFFVEQDQLNDPNVIEQIDALRKFKVTAIEGRDSFLNLADTMDDMPRIERRLNREVTRGSEQIRNMAGNIDRTIGSINRALNRFE